MKAAFHVKGVARKRLALQIGAYTHMEVQYRGAPGYWYDIGPYHIDQEGTLQLPDDADNRRLLQWLRDLGYDYGDESTPAFHRNAPLPKGTVALPRSDFTPQALENLRALIESKASLLKKALGIDALPMEIHHATVMFPWMPESVDAETSKAVTHLIHALCTMAQTQKTIRAVERSVDNEKYAFRCFLIRLGFVGNTYRAERKVLLAKLHGSAAYKEGTK